MRRDEKKSDGFKGSKEWGVDFANSGESGLVADGPNGKRRLHSLSGSERNKLFLNTQNDFADISTLSGLDSPADGRAFAYWDFDRDGWTDVAVINANNPLLNVYRNRIGELPNSNKREIIAIRFVGGNALANSSSEFSNRDGIGAKVTLELENGRKLYREYKCGEGFAAQNSATMVVGIGESRSVKTVNIRWPSGKSQTITEVESGTLLTAYENLAEAPDSVGYEKQAYRQIVGFENLASSVKPDFFDLRKADTGNLIVYTTMATWCPSCLQHLPQVAKLREAFSSNELGLYGMPIDKTDNASKLLTYQDEHSPAYNLIEDLNETQRKAIEDLMIKHKSDSLPSTIVTDSFGKVLAVQDSVPSVSEVRKWLGQLKTPIAAN